VFCGISCAAGTGPLPGPNVFGALFSPNGKTLFTSAGREGECRRHPHSDVATGKEDPCPGAAKRMVLKSLLCLQMANFGRSGAGDETTFMCGTWPAPTAPVNFRGSRIHSMLDVYFGQQNACCSGWSAADVQIAESFHHLHVGLGLL